ncbi:MAG: hypothetical protein QFX33_01160 [Candidatus Nezhaarchaeota archaeon]|nr:hypothetical protein [Candidatus Nezhaarchaeota archaeon]
MPSRLSPLKKLTKEELEVIAASQGIKLPKSSSKKEIISKLSKLPSDKLKEALMRERKEGRERKKTTKRRLEAAVKGEKVTAVEDVEKLAGKLAKSGLRLHPPLIMDLKSRFKLKADLDGDGEQFYKSLSADALKFLYECYVKKSQEDPLYLAYRSAQWFLNKHRKTSRVEVNKEVSGVGVVGALFYDGNDKAIAFLDCIVERKEVSVEQAKEWIKKVIKLYEKSRGSIKRAYLVSTLGFAPDVVEFLISNLGIAKNGFLKLKRKLIKVVDGEIIIGAKEGVTIHLCREKLGEIIQLFP